MKKIIFLLFIAYCSLITVQAQHSDTLHPVADVFFYTWGGGQGGNTFMKYDISSVPVHSVVSNVKLEANVFGVVAPWDGDIRFINIHSQTWQESDFGSDIWAFLRSDTINQLINFGSAPGWASSVNIAPIFLRDYNQAHSFCTIMLKDPDDGTMGPQMSVPAIDNNDSLVTGNILMGFNGYIMIRPHEYSNQSLIPRLVVDYIIAPEVTADPASGTYCKGSNVTLSIAATGDALSYKWQKNGIDIPAATDSTYNMNPILVGDAGNYRCIATNLVGADTSAVAVIAVNALPTVTLTTFIDTCINTSAFIMYGGSPAGGIYSGPGVTGGNFNPATAGTGTHLITYTYADINGCESSASQNITVNPIVTASVHIVPSANPICAGTNVTFTATPTNGGTSPGYQWRLNGIIVGTNSPTYTDNAVINGDKVKCWMSSNAECVTGSPVLSNIDTMIVSSTLIAGVAITTPHLTVCAGSTAVFTATPVNGGGSPSYQWHLNGTLVGSNNPVYSVVVSNGDIINCTLTSSLTCVINNPANSNSITMTVNTPQPVSVSISATPNPSCVGSPVICIATPTNGGLAPTFQWFVNGVPVGNNSPAYNSSSFNDGDNLTCQLTSSDTCTSGNPDTSNSIIITVSPLPSITLNAVSDTICVGSCTDINASGADTYIWAPGVYTGATINVCPTSSTTYTVTGSTISGCTGTASVYIYVDPCTEVSNYNNESFAFYPNPSNGIITIESNVFIEKMELYNVLGKIVYSDVNFLKRKFDLSYLPGGLYFLKMINKNKVILVRKVILEK